MKNENSSRFLAKGNILSGWAKKQGEYSDRTPVTLIKISVTFNKPHQLHLKKIKITQRLAQILTEYCEFWFSIFSWISELYVPLHRTGELMAQAEFLLSGLGFMSFFVNWVSRDGWNRFARGTKNWIGGAAMICKISVSEYEKVLLDLRNIVTFMNTDRLID